MAGAKGSFKFILWACFLFVCSCGVTNDMNKVAFNRNRGRIFIPIAMAQFSVDAAEEIYAMDSLKDRSEVIVNSLDAFFVSSSDTFKVSFEPYKFFFKDDTLMFNDVLFPEYKGYIESDTLISTVKIVFVSPKQSGIRCLEKVYTVTKTGANRDADFFPCSEKE